MRTLSILFAATCFAACAEETRPPGATAMVPVFEQKKIERASLRDIKGDVKVKRAAGDEWIAATERLALMDNDKVRTAKGASASVRFNNGSTLALGEDALVSIAEGRPKPGEDVSDVTVLKGRVDAELDETARQSLSVSTPAAVIRAGRELVFQ
ncbi:MAG: FecR domain-containing protein [Myxococcaceae bacterium]